MFRSSPIVDISNVRFSIDNRFRNVDGFCFSIPTSYKDTIHQMEVVLMVKDLADPIHTTDIFQDVC